MVTLAGGVCQLGTIFSTGTFFVNSALYASNCSCKLILPPTNRRRTHQFIRRVDVDPDYTVRPEPAETLASLKQLAADRNYRHAVLRPMKQSIAPAVVR